MDVASFVCNSPVTCSCPLLLVPDRHTAFPNFTGKPERGFQHVTGKFTFAVKFEI